MERELRERMVELAIADLRNNVDDGEVIDFLEDITDEIYNDLEDENYDYYEDDYDYDYEEEEDSELDRLTEELDRLTEKLDEHNDPFLAALEAVFGPNVNVRVVESREALLDEDDEVEDEAEDLEEGNELDELEEKLRNLKEDEEDLAFSLDMEEFSDDSVKEIARLIKSVLDK